MIEIETIVEEIETIEDRLIEGIEENNMVDKDKDVNAIDFIKLRYLY
jgi:hypothetical protein